jgi:hypothetical protein
MTLLLAAMPKSSPEVLTSNGFEIDNLLDDASDELVVGVSIVADGVVVVVAAAVAVAVVIGAEDDDAADVDATASSLVVSVIECDGCSGFATGLFVVLELPLLVEVLVDFFFFGLGLLLLLLLLLLLAAPPLLAPAVLDLLLLSVTNGGVAGASS